MCVSNKVSIQGSLLELSIHVMVQAQVSLSSVVRKSIAPSLDRSFKGTFIWASNSIRHDMGNSAKGAQAEHVITIHGSEGCCRHRGILYQPFLRSASNIVFASSVSSVPEISAIDFGRYTGARHLTGCSWRNKSNKVRHE